MNSRFLLWACPLALATAATSTPAGRAADDTVLQVRTAQTAAELTAATGELRLRCGTTELRLTEVGPVWAAEATAAVTPPRAERLPGPGTEPTVRLTSVQPKATWQVGLRTAGDEIVVSFTAADAAPTRVRPGLLQVPGRWTALDLSQYQLAHGQAEWPKTFFLADSGLFLCAWWDLSVSHANGGEWVPAQACDLRSGTGPVAPATTQLYQPRTAGPQAGLRDDLHLRLAPRLWDAALPALGEPSEHRQALRDCVFLDVWGAASATELRHLLSCLETLAAPHVRFLTIVENWQAGGFDALLPDSVWLPDYPPNPAVGTVEELRELSAQGRRLGLFGFRTNYALCRADAPSVRQGRVTAATDATGTAAWHTQPSRWPDLARRQETEINSLWQPNASFTDQLTSGGNSGAYLDFGTPDPLDATFAGALRHQRELARLIKDACAGPLGSETLNQQDLIGRYVDFGDFGIMAGHARLFPPDYKLRRMHALTVFYGCGLPYRFFELPPFPDFHAGKLLIWDNPEWMDDYRCCEILLGNAGYIAWEMPWTWTLTEVILVGRLQRHYALVPVEAVEYDAAGRWQSLEELVRSGQTVQTRPWNQKQPEFGWARVTYANGLRVHANRRPEEVTVDTGRGPLVLPAYGWVAERADGRLRAFSAYWPGTRQRVDCLEEAGDGLRFLNPRGATIDGSDRIRLWQNGKLVWSVDPAGRTAGLADGRTLDLAVAPPPLTNLDLHFGPGLAPCRPVAGILRVDAAEDAVRLTVTTPDPQILTPELALAGRAGDQLELQVATDAGTRGQLYFATDREGVSERQVVVFDLQPDGQMRTLRLAVGSHPRWAGARITMLRLDPVHGPATATVTLRSLRLLRP